MKKKISSLLAILLSVAVMLPTMSAFASDFSNYNCLLGKGQTSFVYTGSAFKPTVKVKSKTTSKVLTENVDYKVTYSDNVAVGVGKATISGIGQYSGAEKVVLTFNIKPTKVKRFAVKSSTSSSISLKWDAVPSGEGITGYKVYTCDKNGNNLKKVAETSSTSATVSNLKYSSKYNFVVRAYKKVGNNTLSGDYSKVRNYCTKPNQVEIKSVTNTSDKKAINVKWRSRAGSGYFIEYSTNNKFENAKSIRINDSKTTSKKISVDAKKKYYVRVRAFKEYLPGKINLGKWSAKFSNDYNKTYSTYYSYYVNNPDRTNNLRLACNSINGKIIAPGDTFSFNATVGQRTTARGYKPAHVFAGAEETVMGVGGGVCQVASTIFNAALLGNFQIVERHQHSQRVAYVPLGRDAAIYWGSQDFKFKNNTSRPIKMVMECKDGKISCTIKVCDDVSPKKVNLSVSQSGNHFTLRRTVGGQVNYTTYSTY